MRLFADLVTTLGTSTKTNEKLDALSEYFTTATDKDKLWVIAIFSGRRPKRAVNSTQLWTWCNELARLPDWLFEECYHAVGDLGETIALLLPESANADARPTAYPPGSSEGSAGRASHPLHYYLETLISIEKQDEFIRKEFILRSWQAMTQAERFVFNKLITGNFRIGVSQNSMVNALAKTIHLDPSVIAHRISGNWDPMTTNFSDLMSEHAVTTDHSKPYPFYLAYAIEDEVSTLGDPHEWQAEWKWDGIRGQMIKRNNELFVWSRGEELMTEKFPEYHALKNHLPNGVVLDGEIIPYKNSKASPVGGGLEGAPLPFALLQTRIGRKNITKKQLTEAPIHFFAYDLLEYEDSDIRESLLVA